MNISIFSHFHVSNTRLIQHSKPDLSPADEAAVLAALRTGLLNEGNLSAQLATLFAQRFHAEGAIAVSSGTYALLAALQVLDLKPSSDVILPNYVCPSLLVAIEAAGLKPVLADVGADYLLDIGAVKAVMTSDTGAIILPYTMGIHIDSAPFAALGVPLIEDCAQFIPGAGDLRFPLHGNLMVFSLETTKMAAAGEGGLVVSRNPDLARRLQDLKRYGNTGYKRNLSPLSDLQAALALSQINRIEEFCDARRRLAHRYAAALSDIADYIIPTHLLNRSLHFRLPLRLQQASATDIDWLISAFAERGVAARRPVANLPSQCLNAPDTPTAEALHRSTFSLPLYPALNDKDFETVVKAAADVAAAYRHRRNGHDIAFKEGSRQ